MPSATGGDYALLPKDDPGTGQLRDPFPSHLQGWQIASNALNFLAALSLSINVFLVVVYLIAPRHELSGIMPPQILYSPAQDVLKPEFVTFVSGFEGGLTVYDDPSSPEVDQAWDDLYRYSLSKIPRSQASMLPNATYPVLGDEGNSMVALDVFHQIHCLNLIRKAIYSDHYPDTAKTKNSRHMLHCIAGLRQSFMCSSDISAVVWEFVDGKIMTPHFDVTHTCRNFDAIRDWARQHHFRDFNKENMKIRIE